MMKMRSVAVVLGATSTLVYGHGSMTIPKPRNTVDGNTAPWNGTVSPMHRTLAARLPSQGGSDATANTRM